LRLETDLSRRCWRETDQPGYAPTRTRLYIKKTAQIPAARGHQKLAEKREQHRHLGVTDDL